MTSTAEYQRIIGVATEGQLRAVANDLVQELDACRKVIDMANAQIAEARAVLHYRMLTVATPIMAELVAIDWKDPSDNPMNLPQFESMARIACEAGKALITEVSERHPES